MAIFCPVCGQDRGDAFKFCPLDGTNLEALRKQLGGGKPTAGATVVPGGLATEAAITVPSSPEECKEGLLVLDLLNGELLSSKTRVSAFTNGGMGRLVGAEVPAIMKKMSPQGDELWSYVYANMYIEKYERRQDGKFMMSRMVRDGLPKSVDWTQDSVLLRAAQLARRRKELENPAPAWELLTTEGLSWGMKSSKARALFQGRLLATGEGGPRLVFDREKVSKGFLVVSYKAARGQKSNYAVDLIFDVKDEFCGLRCGNLKQK